MVYYFNWQRINCFVRNYSFDSFDFIVLLHNLSCNKRNIINHKYCFHTLKNSQSNNIVIIIINKYGSMISDTLLCSNINAII